MWEYQPHSRACPQISEWVWLGNFPPFCELFVVVHFSVFGLGDFSDIERERENKVGQLGRLKGSRKLEKEI